MRLRIDEREEINRIIMDELVYGVFRPGGRDVSAGDGANEGGRLRCCDTRLHGNPVDHERLKLTFADA